MEIQKRLKLLHIINTLNPAYGGSVEAVVETATEQLRQGNAVEVLTHDAPDLEWLKRVRVPVIAIGRKGAPGRYGYNPGLVPWLSGNICHYDAVILHCLWEYTCLGAWRVLHRSRTPYFIYTHGMLDPWFEQLPVKHIKKTIYWKLFAHRIFRDARAVVFTCEQEWQLSGRSFSPWACEPLIASLGIPRPAECEHGYGDEFLRAFPHLRGKRILLFFGRIHPKKGLDLLLPAFAAVAARYADLHLVIAGPDLEGFAPALRRLASELRLNDRLTWTGLLAKKELRFGALHAADAGILSSRAENFGLAIVEGLARGVPALISTRVNIWREIVEDGAGFAGNDDVESTAKTLDQWLSLTEDRKIAMRQNALACFEKRFEIGRTTAGFIAAVRARCG
jgi:glycosyltransferase involved in cell wall biosynthesis